MSSAHRISQKLQSRTKHASIDWDPSLAGEPSELITRLQKIRARSTATTQGTFVSSSAPSSVSTTSSKRRRHQYGAEDHADAKDELHWQSSLLTWTRGSTLMRTFSFSSPVLQAFWTLFHVSSTDDIQVAPGKTRHERQSHPPSKALCVFFEQAIHIHFPGLGEQVDMDLPFRFAKAFPAPVGFLVQRQIESEDERIASRLQQPVASSSLHLSNSNVGYPFPDLSNTTDSSYSLSQMLDDTDHASTSQLHEDPSRLLPMIFYLSRCYDDLVPVDRFPQLSFTSNPVTDPKPMTHGPASPFGEIDETVIHVSTENDDASPAIVVTTSQRSSAIRIYAFATRPSAFEATTTLLSAPRVHSTLNGAAANGKVSLAEVHTLATAERDDYQQGTANGHRNPPTTPAASMAPGSTTLGRGFPTNVRRSARIDLERRSSGMTTAGMGRDPSGRSRRISAMHSGTADRRSTGRKDDQATQGRDRTLGNIAHTADGLRLQSQAYQHEAMMEELGTAGTSMRISTNPASAARIRRSSQAAACTPYGGPRTSNRTASSAIKNRPSMNLSRLDTSIDTGRLTSGMVTGAGEGVRGDAVDADNGLIEDDNLDLVRIADMDSFARSFASVCLLDEIKVPGLNTEAANIRVHRASFVRIDADATYLFLSVLSTDQTFVRRLGYQRLGSAEKSRHLAFCKVPSKLHASAVLPTAQLVLVQSLSPDATEIVTSSPDGRFYLHLGPPSASFSGLDIGAFEPLIRGLGRLRLHSRTSASYVIEPVDGAIGSHMQLTSPASSARAVIDLNLRPRCSTTARVMAAFKQALPHRLSAKIISHWLQARFLSGTQPLRQSGQAAIDQDWSALLGVFGAQALTSTEVQEDVITSPAQRSVSHRLFGDDPLLVGLAPLQEVREAATTSSAMGAARVRLDVADAQQALLALYLLAEETHLDSSHSSDEASKIVSLAASLAREHDAESWIDSLSRHFSLSGALSDQRLASQLTKANNTPSIKPPPSDLYQVLLGMLSRSSDKIVTLQNWLCLEESASSMSANDLAAAFPIVDALLQTYSVFAKPHRATQHLSTDVVEAMISHDLSLERMRKLPFGIALPLYQALRCCQTNPPSGRSAELYRLIQRSEVALNASLQRSSLSTASARHIPTHLVRTLPEDAPLDAICAQLFSRDFRLRDVVAMLRTDTVNSVYVAEGENQTEAAITEQHNAAVAAIGERTKALSPGRAMLFMASRSFSSTQKWRISSLCSAVKVRPRGTTIEPDSKADTAGLDWPEFHNGVASVLELNLTGGMHIDSKWIFAHLGEQVTARHAGFLYGLGLMKQLPTLTPVHVFRYLKMRNNLLTVGFLLGMAVSTVGTADPTARHLIGMQLTAFLPPGSAPLNLSTITQTAGLLAMGLVFLGSNHRWTAKRMLDQIGAQESPIPNIQPQHREAYSLSAGLALGLVYLGKGRGDGMKSLPDKRIIARLAQLTKGTGDGDDDDEVSLSGKSSANHGVMEGHEINLTSAPAALAFGLIYLRSNNKMIADVMAPPHTPGDLDLLRPDVLFAHVLARSLILWDSIQPAREWLEGVLLEWMQKRIETGKPLSEATQLAKINMQAGACFAIGLKYAGSKDQKARDCLWMQLDALERQIKVQTVSFFSKIRKAAVRTALDQVRISLAMVMAGSGDVDLLRHLRRAHGDVDAATCYGSHMATHMALGLLFLGGGRFTLGTSDPSIAALLISFLPPFPRSNGDNRAHLQAFRHLWYLAIEPRLLIATDVDTNQLVSLPVKIAAVANNTESTGLAFTPLLLPNQRLLGPIESATARYWPASIDSKSVGGKAATSASAASVVKASSSTSSQILFVKRKTAHLDYLADPHGSRSLSTRAQESAPMDVSSDATAVVGPGTSELQEALRGFASAGKHRELVRSLCMLSQTARIEGKETGDDITPVLRTVMMECLTEDKMYMLPAYVQVVQLEQLKRQDTRAWLKHYRDLRFADEFYRHHFDRLFSVGTNDGSSNQARPLVQPGLLTSLRLGAQQRARALFESNPALQEAIVDYLTTSSEKLPTSCVEEQEAEAFWTVLVVSEVPSADEVRDLIHAMRESVSTFIPAAAPTTEKGKLTQLRASIRMVAEAAFGGTKRPPWTKFILDRLIERMIRSDSDL